MATYVVLHGATAGGWLIGKVARRIRKAGHEIFTPTYTGLGERSHLLNREIGLDTHIQDVLNVFQYEELNDVILVGISYSGMVITAVAEAIPERISHLVYMDSFVPHDGESLADLCGAQVMAQLDEIVQAHGDGWLVPAYKEVESRSTDHPVKTFYDKIAVKNPASTALPRTYICCTEKSDPIFTKTLYQMADRAKDAGWRYRELPSDHIPERDMPDELTALLLELA
jgi:pimeloyl-ACP methyl ester carboxylesterase